MGKCKENTKSCKKGCNFVSRMEKKGDGYKIMYDKTDFIVNYAEDPEVDGHLVIQPRDHFDQIADLCEEQAMELMRWIWRCCTALRNVYSPQKIYVFSFNEASEYHLHVHIKPKHTDAVSGPCFVNYSDPFLKEKRTAVEEEQDDSKREAHKKQLDDHNKKEIHKIKKEIDNLITQKSFKKKNVN